MEAVESEERDRGPGPPQAWLQSTSHIDIMDTSVLAPVPFEAWAREGAQRLSTLVQPYLPEVGREFLRRALALLPPEEARLWGRLGDTFINRSFGLLEKGDTDGQAEEMRRLARELAREGLPFASFIAAFQLYEEALLAVLVEVCPKPEELKIALGALDRVRHNNFATAAVAYLSQYNQKILQLNRDLDDAISMVNAMGFAIEEASAKVGLQSLIVPLVQASQVKYLREEQGVDVELEGSYATPLEVCRAYQRYIRALGLDTEEQYIFEELQNGVRVTVNHNCFHARRCQAQLARGVPLACVRASGMEMALNWKLEKPFVASDKDLKPGESCTFCLRSVL